MLSTVTLWGFMCFKCPRGESSFPLQAQTHCWPAGSIHQFFPHPALFSPFPCQCLLTCEFVKETKGHGRLAEPSVLVERTACPRFPTRSLTTVLSLAGQRCRRGGRHCRSGHGSLGPHWSHVIKKQATEAMSRRDCPASNDSTC